MDLYNTTHDYYFKSQRDHIYYTVLGGAWKVTVKVMWLVSDGSERSMARPQADLLWREGVGTRRLQVVYTTTITSVFIMYCWFIYIEFTFQIYKITPIFVRLIKPYVTV